ncbi:BgTH12-00330 [Blumeria graminis f. sp. triticale]|uniref:BgtASP-21079 n=3 Tax=Blumeria graminis TaxID=34373 RepID=A0A9X9MMA9_BLUGR|nr:hypothetical protein BGT96224_ASP21079 [Blumeria graminis f. sp. tritici 96224]CAD6504827.1 BgTH12-00330 [Blumeria graminis f. sp. triticale]VDB92853.1 BgtASP-21079 [Blumeria graminis f. sp. tritici]
MRLLRQTLSLCLLLASSLVAARKSTSAEISDAISHLPHCCLDCVMPVLGAMNCNLGNLTEFSDCFCIKTEFQAQISSCTKKQCPFVRLIESEALLKTICTGQPRETRRPQIYTSTSISTFFAILFVILRCYSNYQVAKKFWWDDGFLIISTIFFAAFQCLTLWGASYGFGLHIWNAETTHWRGLLLFEWSWELLYIVVQTMTKVSVLLLYFRIFPQVWFRKILFCLIVFMFVHFVAFSVVIVNACKPIKRFWNHALPGKCINTRPVGVVGAACSIVEDIVFLFLPIPLIWQLKLKTSRKIGITLILAVGVIACVASIVRLKFLVRYNETFDQIWDNFCLVVLSQIELCLSIICVCFPAIRLLFSRSNKNVTTINDQKQDSDPSHSYVSDRSNSKRGFISKVRSIISNHTSGRVGSLPWVSTRAPQLSSIYITSHIELTDKDPTSSSGKPKGYESHIAASKPEVPKYHEATTPLVAMPNIVQVDKSGNHVTPFRKLTGSLFRESRLSVRSSTNTGGTVNDKFDQIGEAR